MNTGHSEAVALAYDAVKNSAPELIAKGRGITAQKIIELANKLEIPIYNDTQLIDMLMHLELNTEIPEELYFITAEIFAFIYKFDRENKI